MNRPHKIQTVTFIVRLWVEYLYEQPPRWCGVIEAAGSGEQIHFSQLKEINLYIQQKTTQAIKKENPS